MLDGDGIFNIFEGLVGNAAEGTGFLDRILELLAGAGRSSATADMLGAGRAAWTGESLFARFSMVVDNLLDYLILRDLLGGAHGRFTSAQHAFASPEFKSISDVLRGHAFIHQQLGAHRSDQEIAPIFAEYDALGTSLPPENLLKKAHRALAKKLHPDMRPIDNELFAQLKTAEEVLEDTAKCQFYNECRATNPTKLQGLFKQFCQEDWGKFYQQAAQKSRGLFLEYTPEPENFTGVRKWVSTLSPAQSAALIFSGVVSVGVCAYLGAQWYDQYQAKKPAALPQKSLSHVDRAKASTHVTASLSTGASV